MRLKINIILKTINLLKYKYSVPNGIHKARNKTLNLLFFSYEHCTKWPFIYFLFFTSGSFTYFELHKQITSFVVELYFGIPLYEHNSFL